uniref:Uncharacterized protein n=1 Tax=Opuntia streptacantha TaxID=393608 RepID=A0A7C9CJL2_OPUST
MSLTSNMLRFLTTISYICMDLNLRKSLGTEIKCTVDRLWNWRSSGSPPSYFSQPNPSSFCSSSSYEVITSLVGRYTSTLRCLPDLVLPPVLSNDSPPGLSTRRTTPFLNTHTPDIN